MPDRTTTDPERVRWTWNGLEGRVTSPPEWCKPGYVRFRPDFGPNDYIVPENEVERA